MNVSVVLHIDEPTEWELVFRNAFHLIQMVDTPDPDIRVIINSEAVRELVSQSMGSALPMMQKLAEQGVHFAVCNNSLNSFGVHPQELVPFTEVVPADVLELALRRQEDYAYLES